MSSVLAECEADAYLKEEKEEDIWHIWRRRRRRRRMRMKLGEELSFSGQEETIAICTLSSSVSSVDSASKNSG
jgi:hypothetical protein